MLSRVKIRIVALGLMAALLIGAFSALCMTGAAGLDKGENAARALNYLGLFKGTEKGYRLEKELNRAEAVTMIIRLMGCEDDALECTYSHPFGDVPSWADRYVAYAYQNGITRGKSADRFASLARVRDCEFLTMLLRMLDFKDGTDFVWDAPYNLSRAFGICESREENENFVRGDVVLYCVGVLQCSAKNESTTVAENLIAKRLFSQAEYERALIIAGIDEETTEENSRPVGTEPPAQTSESETTETLPEDVTMPAVTTPKVTDEPLDFDQLDTDGWSGIIVP